MLAKKYQEFVDFVKKGKLPGTFASTKSNFKRTAKTMSVNKKGVLLRDQKCVVKWADRDAIFRGKICKKGINKIEHFTKGIQGATQLGRK